MIEKLIKDYQKQEEHKPILVIGKHNKELSKILDFRFYHTDIYTTRKEQPEHYTKYFVVDSTDYTKAIENYVCEFQASCRRNDFI